MPTIVRHTLPAPLTRFVGREREIAEIGALLHGARLLTLTGPGGCGKTRLALSVATGPTMGEVAAACPDSIWFVEFASLTDPALVPQVIAATLGVREEPLRPLLDTMTEAMRPRAPLLVLDNCEHVINAVADTVDALLRGCPRIRILATSREALRVPGEVTWRVPSLSLPDNVATSTVARLAESEAVQLFVDRMRLRQPSFALADENAASVAAICRQLDGMPLALELAAARASALTIAQMEARLGDALRLLTAGERTAVPRHRTLRATLDWSHALLSEDERTVLRGLAVFAGGCDLAAAEAICAGAGIAREAVLPLLSQLIDKSLVQMEERRGEARYRLLETVRQYARERLDASGEEERIQHAHAQWYLTLAERASPELNGPAMVTWLDRLAGEHDNLRAAMRWLLERACAESCLRFGASLVLFWYARDHVNEGKRWLDAFLALDTPDEPAAPYTTALTFAQYGAGRLAMYQGDYAEAGAMLEASLATARKHDHPRHMTYALTQLGHLALYRGEFAKARTWYEEGLAIREMLGDPRGIAIAIGSLGRVALFAGDIDAARTLLEESLAIFRRVVAYTDTVGILYDLGLVAIEQRDFDRAHAHLAEGLTCSREWDIKQGIAQCLEGFALLEIANDRAERGLRLIGAANALRAAIHYPVPPILENRRAGALDAARRTLGEAASGRARAAGEAMALDTAIAEALQSAAHAGSAPDLPRRRTTKEHRGGLTAREWQVVAHVAAGETNRRIAETLFITEKTVEWHVTNSLQKLGFRTRSELAVWAVTTATLPAAPDSSVR